MRNVQISLLYIGENVKKDCVVIVKVKFTLRTLNKTEKKFEQNSGNINGDRKDSDAVTACKL